MKRITLPVAVLILAVLIAACAPATAAPITAPTEPALTASPAATASPVASESPIATESPATTATPTQAAATEATGVPVTGGEETVIRASLSESYGPILVNGDGRAVYIFLNDTQNGDSSACTGECTTQWEPVTPEGDLVAGPGAIQNLLSTITRDDGTEQVTYNGWPLYYYYRDHGAGSAAGQGEENLWFLVLPSGKPVRE